MQIIIEAVEAYMSDNNPEIHCLSCYLELLSDIERADMYSIINYEAFIKKLKSDVSSHIERRTEIWSTKYVCKPSRFIKSHESIFYKGNEELAQYECDFIENTQLNDGSWTVPWNWNKYPNEFAISVNRWKSSIIIENMLYLMNMKYKKGVTH